MYRAVASYTSGRSGRFTRWGQKSKAVLIRLPGGSAAIPPLGSNIVSVGKVGNASLLSSGVISNVTSRAIEPPIFAIVKKMRKLLSECRSIVTNGRACASRSCAAPRASTHATTKATTTTANVKPAQSAEVKFQNSSQSLTPGT